MHTRKPLFAGQSSGFQLFIFIFLLLLGALGGMLIGLGILLVSPGLDLSSLQSNVESSEYLQAARIIQLSSQIGLFIVPPLVYSWLFYPKKRELLGFSPVTDYRIFIYALALMFASLPFIHWLAEINQAVHLPESMQFMEQWFKQKEVEAEKLTEIFLNVTSPSGFLLNLLMIGVIPAIGEELVFRSVLQKLLIKLFRNASIGIVVTSILFSLMHFQFYGFIPRVVLGLFLGFLFYWSGSILVPILMHLANNSSAVVVYYLHANDFIETPMKDFGGSSEPVYVVISFVLTIGLLWISKAISTQRVSFTDKKNA